MFVLMICPNFYVDWIILEKSVLSHGKLFSAFSHEKHFSNWHFSTTMHPNNIPFCVHLHYIHSVSSVKDFSCNPDNKKVMLV